MKILTGVGHVARYLAGAAVAGGVFLTESALVIIPACLLVGIVGGSAFGAIVYFVGGFLLAFFLGFILVTFVIAPAVLIGELTSRRTFLPAAPIVALVVIGLLALTGSVIWTVAADLPLADAMLPAVLALIALTLPTIAFGVVTYPAGQAISWLEGRFPRMAGFARRSAESLGRRFPRLANLVSRLKVLRRTQRRVAVGSNESS